MRRARAQVMVLFAFSVVGLVALIGLVVDGANLYLQRRTAQTAADAAALAGARALRNATAPNQLSAIASAIGDYAAANAFGIQPNVSCAYFVGASGAPLLDQVVLSLALFDRTGIGPHQNIIHVQFDPRHALGIGRR